MNAILLAGAALVGLPILLHLIMKQEPKRLPFPAFRFLKQKLKTNQRKLRLRHFILLALRMLIIALFCLTLYQPTFKSDQLNIRGEQPVATVIIIDTSPSMGYVANDKSRLEEARLRALELLSELPDKSPVVILETSDLNAAWLPDVAAARRRLEEIKEPRGGNQSVSSAIATAYQLLAKVEQETESPDPLQKLVAVFTDRTAASWDANRTEDLKKLRETVPDPKAIHVVFDFGADQPTNVSILSVDMKPQVIAENNTAHVLVTVGAVGAAGESVEATVVARPVAGGTRADTSVSKVVTIPNGQTRTVPFEFRDLKAGLNQWEFALKAPDNLMIDNKRFLTFKVGAARRILTITDDKKAAVFWQVAHLVQEEFSCLVVTPDQIKIGDGGQAVVQYEADPKKPNDPPTVDDLRSFEAVCLLAVRDPNQPAGSALWDKLRPYLQTGGKLIVVPGRDGWMNLTDYNVGASDLMPGTFGKVIETKKLTPAPPLQKASSWDEPREGKNGVTLVLDEKALKHPLLKPIEDWRQQKSDRVDVIANPRTAWKFWDVTRDPNATVVAYYNDAEKPEARHPAILERPVLDKEGKPRGKVVLLTTRMDVTNDKDDWSDYWAQEGSSWFVAFPNLLVRYLAGDTADANFNYPTGATVTVPLPRGKLTRESVVVLEGPRVEGNDAIIRPGDKQTDIRLVSPKTNNAGNFALSVTKDEREIWRDGFSLNVPPDESNLDKVPLEAVEDLVGAGRVIPVTRNVTLADLLSVTLGQPVDLFPWLLIAVLAAQVAEGFIANRFYRRAK
ncbi:BatA and WFA domain-containing protein [Gemmata sp. G18]|uniref:BatA and WFA domain-containing protein n=1 Tax=Gemmata palustris TaxID=2822762 RepID=A0ABS5BN06_9BACT|nr:BatA domain-containing protein [Gemmata palustris]MBP3955113.1 BatA and WFA domain-containing protein [Gemmata palustris]